MRVLIIKTSSMGDIIHTLPALTDAGKAIPGIQFDWLVEENFAEIPKWHPLVSQVIPFALRRWRKNLFSRDTYKEMRQCLKALRVNHYDFIIDAQGLVKSAIVSRLAKGLRCGFDKHSARESLAAYFYQRKYSATKKQHAINRIRKLFSEALNYPLSTSIPDYGVNRQQLCADNSAENYLVFLHATTWETKHWPEAYWIELAKLAAQNNFRVKLPWGNSTEQARAQRIAAVCENAEVLPRLNLLGIAKILAGAKAIVAVDTGLGHLAAALNVPTISLYGPTNPELTGALGESQHHLRANFSCSPCLNRHCTYLEESSVKPACFKTLSPDVVWNLVSSLAG